MVGVAAYGVCRLVGLDEPHWNARAHCYKRGMKAFEILPAQVAAVTGALVADELSWRFRRHMDLLTIASLSPLTRLGEGSSGERALKLDPEEYAACARRAAAFFGAPADVLLSGTAETLEDWSVALSAEIQRRLTQFTFTPAGRDSEKESCVYHADEIFADAAAVANILYGRRRIISLVAPHSLMGFVLTILAPNLQRIESIDARGRTPEELQQELQFGDAVIATPSLWRFLLREGVKAPDNAMGVYFGEPMAPDLAVAMRKAGFAAQRELFGSTETGVVGWRDTPGEAFLLFDQFTGDGPNLTRRAPNGDIRTIALLDQLNWEQDRRFRLSGRRDGAVQVGAVNVFPKRIGQVIGEHADVADCDVRIVVHADGANRLVAHIVLDAGKAPTESLVRKLDSWCRARLHPYERPRIYNFETGLTPPDAGGAPIER